MQTIQTLLENLKTVISLLNDREEAIYSRRLVAKDPETLDEIGKDFGLTRERIRQIESDLIKKLRKNGGDDLLKLANLPTQERWVKHFSQLGDSTNVAYFEPTPGSALEILRAIGLVESWDGPWVTNGIKKIFRKVRGPYLNYFITEVTRQGPTISEFTKQMEELGLEPKFVDEWIDSIGLQISGNRVRGGHLTGLEFVQDLLEVSGHPLNWDSEIAPKLEGKWNERGILGRVQEETGTFTRTDIDSYGLAEWGFPTYEGIAREIEKVIEQFGPVKTALLVELLTAKFSVAEDSIRAYAKQGKLCIKDGLVQFVEKDVKPQLPPKLADMNENQLNGLTVLDGKFEYRFAVNHDRLRGSGSPVASGLMAVIGLARGFNKQVDVENLKSGKLNFSWNRGGQPLLGSVRLLLIEAGAQEGQTALLTFHGTEGAIHRTTLTIDK